MKKKEFPEDEGKTENIYVSNLGDFSAEFAHHLNQDWSWSRSCAYVEDLARKGLSKEKMYEEYRGYYGDQVGPETMVKMIDYELR